MSNDKLYTEEQLVNTIEAIRDYIKNYPEKFHESMIEKHLKNLGPIEIPSDSLCINCDESESTHKICMHCIIKIGKENIQLPSDDEIDNHIEDDFLNATEVHKYSEEAQLLMKAMCKAGALWMRDKIQGGNK